MAGSVVIVDYDSGNLHSAEKAFARAAGHTGHDVVTSRTTRSGCEPLIISFCPASARSAIARRGCAPSLV